VDDVLELDEPIANRVHAGSAHERCRRVTRPWC
jgi:hypothetical protein